MSLCVQRPQFVSNSRVPSSRAGRPFSQLRLLARMRSLPRAFLDRGALFAPSRVQRARATSCIWDSRRSHQ
eukprot:1899506-Lingulodinium_polyedra.AAC.1